MRVLCTRSIILNWESEIMPMKKRKIIIAIGIANLGLAFALVGSQAFLRGELFSHLVRGNDDPEPYVLTLDSSKTPNILTSDFQDNVAGTVTTSLGNSISMNFVKAKATSGKFVTLGSRGMIYTFGSEQGGISGINAVTVNFTGNSLAVRTSQTNTLVNGGATTTGPTMLTSGTRVEIPSSRFISFIGGEGTTDITSIQLEYLCSDSEDIKKINGTYTGTGNDGYNYSLNFNNGVATMTSINKDTADTYTGTATWSGNNVECAFTTPAVTYNFTISADAYQLSYVNKSGSAAESAPEVDFYRVYDIDNFEAYQETGTGWDKSNNNKYNVTGFKSAYICEYQSGGSTEGPISGAGWNIMQTTTYMALNKNEGHNSNQSGAFKGRATELHFFHMKGYFGIPSVIGRGTKLSFWAKGPYTDENLTTPSAYGTNVIFALYYTAQVNSSTLSQKTEKSFYVPAGNDWEEFTMDLDSSKNYYAYSISTKNYINDDVSRLVPIDDIRIYTVSPAAQAQTLVNGTFHGTTYSSEYMSTDPIMLALGDSGKAAAVLYNYSAVADSYTMNGNNITVTFSDANIGTITGTYNSANNSLSNLNISGNIAKRYNSNSNPNGRTWNSNGSITMSAVTHAWGCDEQSVEMRDIFKREWRDPNESWQHDHFNDNRVESVNSNYITGGHAMRVRPYAAGSISITLYQDVSVANVKNLSFWVYNSNNTDKSIRLFINGDEIGTKTATANGWTFISCGFSSRTVTNFKLMDENKSSGSFIFDDISLY